MSTDQLLQSLQEPDDPTGSKTFQRNHNYREAYIGQADAMSIHNLLVLQVKLTNRLIDNIEGKSNE